MITIGPNSWPGFQGLYHTQGEFVYVINDEVYETLFLERVEEGEEDDELSVQQVLNEWNLVPSFQVDPQGSDILLLISPSRDRYMLYQRKSDGRFVELIPRQEGQFEEYDITMLKIPSPNGEEIDGEFTALASESIDDFIVGRLNGETATYDQILNLLNQSVATPQQQIIRLNLENTIFQESYKTLLKRLYNLTVILPEYLIFNGLKVNFIPFSQVSSIQIIKYEIDPLLQSWSDNGNTILTLVDNNGQSYLVKARFDPINNQIFPPI